MTVYFFVLPHQSWEMGKAAYQQDIVVIAEGLSAMGHECIGNTDYWPTGFQTGEFVIKGAPAERAFDSSLVIVSWMFYINNGNYLPDILHALKNKVPLVFTDMADGYCTPSFKKEFRIFDKVLKCHYNQSFHHPANMVPWCFGISNRYLNTIRAIPFSEKKKEVLWNFRISHGLREKAYKEVLPVIEDFVEVNRAVDDFNTFTDESTEEFFWWKNSGQRHNLGYFERLANSKIVACFGGGLISRWSSNSFRDKAIRKVMNLFGDSQNRFVYQWDSYRLWESFTAGAVVLHYNLEEWGATFPTEIRSGVHYLGIGTGDSAGYLKDLINDETRLKSLAEQGRQHALDNYTPVPSAKRLLRLMNLPEC